MSGAPLVTWFAAALIGCVAFLLLVLAGYAVTERRRLRTAGATRAALIIWKRLAGPVVNAAGPFLGGSTRAVDLVGASLWLEWDERWGVHGETMGRVVRQVDSGTRSNLLIETAVPQALPTGPASAVWFVPTSARDLRTHRLAVVRGTLRDHDASDLVDAQRGQLAAEIVVLSCAGRPPEPSKARG